MIYIIKICDATLMEKSYSNHDTTFNCYIQNLKPQTL